MLKVENESDGGIAFEKEVATTLANEWEELTFDYSEIDDRSYQKIVLIFEMGTMGDGSADFTFLFDDIKLVSSTAIKETSKINASIFSSKGFIHIKSENALENASLKVYDLSGKEMLNGQLTEQNNAIPFNGKGIYIVELKSEGKKSVQKLLFK